MNLKLIKTLAHHIESDKETGFEMQSRRQWLKSLGMISASGLILAACGDDSKEAAKAPQKSDNQTTNGTKTLSSSDLIADAGLLNAAIALEHEAIALYTAAAGLDFMKAAAVAPILAIAGTFLSHHQSHAAALKGAIDSMREKESSVPAAVTAKDASEYVNPVASKLTDVKMVLRLASLKEMQASQAYLGLVPKFKDPNLALTNGMLGGDEAAHYGALRAALFAVLKDSDVTPETVIPAALPSGFKQTF